MYAVGDLRRRPIRIQPLLRTTFPDHSVHPVNLCTGVVSNCCVWLRPWLPHSLAFSCVVGSEIPPLALNFGIPLSGRASLTCADPFPSWDQRLALRLRLVRRCTWGPKTNPWPPGRNPTPLPQLSVGVSLCLRLGLTESCSPWAANAFLCRTLRKPRGNVCQGSTKVPRDQRQGPRAQRPATKPRAEKITIPEDFGS